MPLPKPTPTERQEEFINRCIPFLVAEGKDREQAAGICYGIWQRK